MTPAIDLRSDTGDPTTRRLAARVIAETLP